MNKCIIFYVSQHHQNTEKLLKQAIGGEPLAELVPLTDTPLPDRSGDCISYQKKEAEFEPYAVFHRFCQIFL